jgi:hypothetical protein
VFGVPYYIFSDDVSELHIVINNAIAGVYINILAIVNLPLVQFLHI